MHNSSVTTDLTAVLTGITDGSLALQYWICYRNH